MAEKLLHLDQAVRVILDANGEAQAIIGPGYAHETWSNVNITVSVNSSEGATPTVKVYRGSGISPTSLIDGTYDGRLDTAGLGIDVPPGQKLTISWTGGEPGIECVASLFGQQKIRY